MSFYEFSTSLYAFVKTANIIYQVLENVSSKQSQEILRNFCDRMDRRKFKSAPKKIRKIAKNIFYGR